MAGLKFYQPLLEPINGVTVSFHVSGSFVADTVRYFLNGVEYRPGTDYIEIPLNMRVDLLTVVPQVGDEHWVHYQSVA